MFHELYDELSNGTAFTLSVSLARPKSTGSVTLSSSNPDATPVVDANVFHHPDDIQFLIKGIAWKYSHLLNVWHIDILTA